MKLNRWLSDFFDINFYDLNQEDLQLKLKFKKGVYQILADSETNHNLLKNFFYVQSKYYLEKSITSKKIKSSSNIIIIDNDILNRLDFSQFEVFISNSRFLPFGKDLTTKYYYEWFKNSLCSKMDQHVIGYLDEKNNLLGFVTYTLKDKAVKVGLIGTFKEYSSKGVGQSLIDMIHKIGLENKKEIIILSTQGSNIKALNLYIRNGFMVKDVKHWFYGGGYFDKI